MKRTTRLTRITVVCKTCGYTTRRSLVSFVAGCRGVHETPEELARCPRGHGELARKDAPSPWRTDR